MDDPRTSILEAQELETSFSDEIVVAPPVMPKSYPSGSSLEHTASERRRSTEYDARYVDEPSQKPSASRMVQLPLDYYRYLLHQASLTDRSDFVTNDGDLLQPDATFPLPLQPAISDAPMSMGASQRRARQHKQVNNVRDTLPSSSPMYEEIPYRTHLSNSSILPSSTQRLVSLPSSPTNETIQQVYDNDYTHSFHISQRKENELYSKSESDTEPSDTAVHDVLRTRLLISGYLLMVLLCVTSLTLSIIQFSKSPSGSRMSTGEALTADINRSLSTASSVSSDQNLTRAIQLQLDHLQLQITELKKEISARFSIQNLLENCSLEKAEKLYTGPASDILTSSLPQYTHSNTSRVLTASCTFTNSLGASLIETEYLDSFKQYSCRCFGTFYKDQERRCTVNAWICRISP